MSSPPLAATSPQAFEWKYQSQPDPWNFRESPYERDRYQKILQSLSRAGYRHAFEPGCSVGELTAALAERCDRVTATDVSPTALAQARQRCEKLPNVEFRVADVATMLPLATLDLVVFSEIGYYFTETMLAQVIGELWGALQPGGELLAAHWLGHSQDHVLHGDRVHEILRDSLDGAPLVSRRFDQFRLDSWIKR